MQHAVVPCTCLCLILFQAHGILHCEWSAEWTDFRDRLQRNAQVGFPFDHDLVLEAQSLLSHGTEHDGTFFQACNYHSPVQPPCLYGLVAALWVMARATFPGGRSYLQGAYNMFASDYGTMDFMESAGWSITSLDIIANLQRPEEFRLPQELEQHYLPVGTPTLLRGFHQVIHGQQPWHQPSSRAPATIVVWEIGMHASLSAEPLNMWARFLSATISHRNLIQDQYPPHLPNKCQSLYGHPRLTCDEERDDITAVFRKRLPESATSATPIKDMDAFIQDFHQAVKPRLGEVDVFLCTVPYLCLLFADMRVPALGYFGHPLLFMVPQDEREQFWLQFMTMARRQSVRFAVSDSFLQMQYEYQVGGPPLPAIRTHALYTGATHYPERRQEVLVLDRPHDCVLMCVLQHLMEPTVIAPESSLREGILRFAHGRYPFSFLTRSLTDKQFATFAQFRAVVLFPYDMDLLTFYEFYSMTMPVFMPSHISKYLFQQNHMNYDGQWAARRHAEGQFWPRESGLSPFDESSVDAAHLIVSFTDYVRFPEIQFFASIPHLLDMLLSADFNRIVQGMTRFNQDSLVQTVDEWRFLFSAATGSVP